MYKRVEATKKANIDLKAQQVQEAEKLSAANATIATLERRAQEANTLCGVLTGQRGELVQKLAELQQADEDDDDGDDSSDEEDDGEVGGNGAEEFNGEQETNPFECNCDRRDKKASHKRGCNARFQRGKGLRFRSSVKKCIVKKRIKKAKVTPAIVSANTVKAFIALLEFLDDVTKKVTDLRNNESLNEDARVHLLESTGFGPFHLSVPEEGKWTVKDACEWGVDNTTKPFQGRRISRREYMCKFLTTATQDCRGTGVHQAGLRFLQNNNGVQTEDYVQCMLGHTAGSLYVEYAPVHGDKI